MEVIEVHQGRLQLMAEKRKWQTEVENKRRQLEDDRRALQHLKSKALRERWLLDGSPAAGPQHDDVKRQLEEDEAKTRILEETIGRLERELVSLETEEHQTITHATVTLGSDVEGKGHSSHQMGGASMSDQVVQATAEVKVHKSPQVTRSTPTDEMKRAAAEVKVHKSPQVTRSTPTDEMKRAMYSVEIKVERDRLTGETRVLSTNTTFPVDLSHHGIKVYEDKQKVVHEMNGEDGIHLLSCSEVEELIHKADEASMMSQAVTTVTSLPTAEVQEEPGPEPDVEPDPEPDIQPGREQVPQLTAEITGLETTALGEPSVGEASAENPVTMVFMGYQSVEDEDETKRVLGLQGTVKAELVLIDDANGKGDPPTPTTPPTATTPTPTAPPTATIPTVSPTATAPPATAPTATATAPTSASSKPPEATRSNGETAGEAGQAGGGVVEVKKDKQPCKCCSIM